MNYKIVISILAIILAFLGYIPYVYNIIKKKTKPHCFTWFISTISGFTLYALQVTGGAGVGSWSLLAASIICLIIFLLSLGIGNKDITRSDIIFLVLALFALFLWFVVKQPVLSLVLLNAVEVLGFVPTIRKSWNSPYSETLFLYEVCILRHGLSIFALQKFNVLTVLTPVIWTVVNIIITSILIIRRWKIKQKGAA